MVEPVPEPPRLSGFDYVSALGHGGFSEVYLYRQKLPRRHVAVKVLRIDAADTATRREFVAEANAMAQLSSHPSIATIFAADISTEGHPYLVMEYCPGGSLGARIKDGPMPVDEVLNIGARMAGALESAHRAGIIHRDVKPSNILINELKSPVLTDFGISIGGAVSDTTIMRDTSTSTTRSSGLSVPWAPCEAFLDDPPSDPRSDVYSLAASLFTLLEGRTPFELATGNNGAIALSRRIERGEITPPTTESVPESLHALLRDAMAVDMDARPSSALKFAESLQEQQRELGLRETPIEILGETAAEPAGADEVSAETTVVRTRAPVEPTVVRVEAAATEIDVDTRPRPDRGSSDTGHDVGTKRLRGKRRIRRVIAIVAAAILVATGVAAIVIFSGTKVPPCPTAFANAVSQNHDGADVTAIWWGSVPELLTANPDVICGVATGDTEIYVMDGFATSRISTADALEGETEWSCEGSLSLYRCRNADTGARMIITSTVPSAYAQHLTTRKGTYFYVEVYRAGVTTELPTSSSDETEETDVPEVAEEETGIPLCASDFLVRQPVQDFETVGELVKVDVIVADDEIICGYQYRISDPVNAISQAIELALPSATARQGTMVQRLVDQGYECGAGQGSVTDGDVSKDFSWQECTRGALKITVGAVPLGAEFLVTQGEVLQVIMTETG